VCVSNKLRNIARFTHRYILLRFTLFLRDYISEIKILSKFLKIIDN